MRTVVRVTVPLVAVRTTRVLVVTFLVVTGKVAKLPPSGMMMLTGTVALGSLLVRVTVIPPFPAGPSRLTSAVLAVPPVIRLALEARRTS